MSQTLLRRVTWVYATLLMVANFFMYQYIYRLTFLFNQYAFDKEMILRVSYVTAMIEWIPLNQWLSKSDALSTVSETTPFLVKIQKPQDVPIEVNTIAMSSFYPTVVYKYSPTLNAVISVTEGEITEAGSGVYQELLAIASCAILLIPFVLFGTLAAGNLLAAARYRRTAVACVWVGYIVGPAALTIGMIALSIRTIKLSFNFSWLEDVRRSALLYATMFTTTRSLLTSNNAALTFAASLKHVNENVVADQSYQVVLAIGEAQTVSPPLYSQVVEKALFSDAVNSLVDFDGYLYPYFYAGASVPSIESLIVVVRDGGEKVHIGDARYLPVLLLGVATTFVFGVVLLAAWFPFHSLGYKGFQSEGRSPWSNRLPKYWPYMKLLELGFLTGMVLLVMCMGVSRLSNHFNRTRVLAEYYDNRIEKLRGIQTVSNLLAQSYSSVLNGNGWSSDFIQYSPVPLTSSDEIGVAQFYTLLSSLLEQNKYFLYTTGAFLASQTELTWPVLSNTDYVKSFLQTQTASEDLLLLQHWILRDESAFIVACMVNDKDFLASGSATILSGVQDSAAVFGQTVVDDFTNALSTLPIGMQSYLSTATMVLDSTITMRDYAALYNMESADAVMAIEDSISSYWYYAVPANRYLCLTYSWMGFLGFKTLFGAVSLVLLYFIFDAHYTALFFSDSTWTWLWTSDPDEEPETELIDSNDYTTPRSTLRINSRAIQRGVRHLCVWNVVVVLTACVLCAVCFSTSQSSISALNAEMLMAQSNFIPLSENTFAGTVVEMSFAEWCRALLSQNNTYIRSAIGWTATWTSMKSIQWNGGPAQNDGERMLSTVLDSLHANALKLAVESSWIRKEPELDGVYRDEAELLKQFDSFVHFPNYDNCLSYVIGVWETYVNAFLKCILLDGAAVSCVTAAIQPMVALVPMCGPQAPAGLEAYLQRVAALQRLSLTLLNPPQMASLMTVDTQNTKVEVSQMIEKLQDDFSNMQSESSMKVPWVTVLFGWISAAVAVVVFYTAKQLHWSVYYN